MAAAGLPLAVTQRLRRRAPGPTLRRRVTASASASHSSSAEGSRLPVHESLKRCGTLKDHHEGGAAAAVVQMFCSDVFNMRVRFSAGASGCSVSCTVLQVVLLVRSVELH